MDTQAVPTCDEAVANAARLLRNAEVTTDLALVERLDEMALTWVRIAELQNDRG